MKKRVLLIQFSETHGNRVREYLEDRGYKVISAGSGLSALMLARNMPMDIILLDVALPDIEGMDLCRLFRRRPETLRVPIILLTTRGYRPQQSSDGTEGPDDYLEKPFSEADLDIKIDSVLALKAPAAATPDNPVQQTSPGPKPAPALITVQQQVLKPEAEQLRDEAAEELPRSTARPAEALPDALRKPVPANPQPAASLHPMKETALSEKAPDARPAEEPPAEIDLPLLPFNGTGITVVDPGTGLFGKAQFEAMLDKEFKRAVRFKQPMSLMLIDLDGRSRGQIADEALVKAIIVLVQKTIREVDTPAWWSGESFIVLLPNTSATDALQAAARILESVALHPFSWPDATRVTMNIGVVGLPNPAIETKQQLIESAGVAMRRARDLMTPPPFDIRSRRR